MRILLLLPIVIFISGCQTQPITPKASNNLTSCNTPQYLNSYQRNLCARQKAGAAPANKPATTMTPNPKYKLTAEEISLIKKGVAQELKDPTSPIFGKIEATKSKENTIFVCGFVNAKNSYGAYTGQKPFMGGFNRNNFVLVGIGENDILTDAIYNVCTKSGNF